MSLPVAPSRRRSAVLVAALATALSVSTLGPAPQATAAGPAPTLTSVGAASAAPTSTSHVVKVPASVRVGDTLLLFLTTNSASGSLTGPSGWQLLKYRNGSSTRGRVWTRTATAADAGASVTVRTGVTVKSSISVAAYRSSAGTSAVTFSAVGGINGSATTHRTPAGSASQPGSWLVSYWGGKSAGATTWTTPTNTTRRTGTSGSGTNRASAVLADSGRPVATGSAAARLARSSRSVSGSQLFTVTVSPGVAAANRAPVASFGSSCTSLTCTFDGSGSSDPDGDPLTYVWTFGDGGSAATASPSHVYRSTGTRTVSLTVDDGTTSTTTTRQVRAAYAEPLPGHTTLVPETPRTDLPKISNGVINDIEVVGSRVYVAGTFTGIVDQQGAEKSYSQRYLAAYDLESGLVDPAFTPVFDGNTGFDLTSVEASPDGTRLYVTGGFNSVNGVTRKGLVRLDPDTGATVSAFTADTDARATDVAVTDSTVYVGGRFAKVNGVTRSSLAAVDAETGAVDPQFVNNLSGGIGVNGGLTVQKLMLTHDGSKLLVVHTGRRIAGQERYGVGMIATTSQQLLPWRTRLWEENLQFVGGIQRIITGSIAPNDEWFVVASGSGGDRPPINDTVVAYSMAGGDDVEPRWVSRAFDSVYGTAISEKAVYIGGHFAWNEAPESPQPWPGADDVGYGTGQGLSGYGLGDSVVNREHLGALNPEDGTALEWNPGSLSDIGNTAMALTPSGLLTGGDTPTQGGYNVGRVAFFDLDSVAPGNGVETTITKPISGRVLPTGTEFTIEGTATAPDGVRKVFVEVQDRGSAQWLGSDRTTWGGAANMEADVTATSATEATWSLTLMVPRNVRMLSRARAQNNSPAREVDPTKAIKKFETFGLTDSPPTMSYTAPLAGVVNTKTFTISGDVSDDRGATGISMTIKDSAGRYLQDDGTVDSTYNAIGIALDQPNATYSTWSREITVPTEGRWEAQARARDTGGNSSLDTRDRSWDVTEGGQAPSVSISSPGSVVPPTAPLPVEVRPGGRMTFRGTATDDGHIKSVHVALLNNSTGENLTVDGTWGIDNGLNLYKLPVTPDATKQSHDWTWTTPQDLTPGNYTFAVMARDNDDIATPQSAWAIMTMNAVVQGDAPPKATIDVKGVQPPSENLTLDLTGSATDDADVDEVRLVVKDLDTSRYLTADGEISRTYTTVAAELATPDATSTTWSRPVVLPTEGNWNVTAFARDSAGQRDLSSLNATARYPVYPGDRTPWLNEDLLAPTEGSSFTEGRIFVSGRAEDDNVTRRVEVAVVDGTGKFLGSTGSFGAESWRAAFLTSPGTPGSNFSYTTPVLPAGTYQVRVRAVDNHGLVTTTPSVRTVTVSIPADNAAPTAVLAVPSCAENVCTFDARGSIDENAARLTYSWNFGNGLGVGPNPKRTFTSAGTYRVTLTAKDEWGISSTPVVRDVTIVEPRENTAPSPVIQTPSCNGLTCNFSAVGTTDNPGDVVTYAWSFGDTANNAATGAATSHVFTAADTYTVTLTATDGWGRSSVTTRQVTVTAP